MTQRTYSADEFRELAIRFGDDDPKKALAKWWGVAPLVIIQFPWASVWFIAQTLASVLNDNQEAERKWLRAPRDAFGGQSALQRMIAGHIADVVELCKAELSP